MDQTGPFDDQIHFSRSKSGLFQYLDANYVRHQCKVTFEGEADDWFSWVRSKFSEVILRFLDPVWTKSWRSWLEKDLNRDKVGGEHSENNSEKLFSTISFWIGIIWSWSLILKVPSFWSFDWPADNEKDLDIDLE